MLHLAEIETRRNLVLAAGDPAGSSVPTSGVPAGSVPTSSVPASHVSVSSIPASSVPAGSVPASHVPASYIPVGSVLAGSINSAEFGDTAASEYVPAIFTTDPAATSPLPPGHSLGSSEHTTRFPSPSDLGNYQHTAGIFSFSSYDTDFYADVTNLASNVAMDPVATKRVNTIHPQSQIIRELQSPVQKRSTVQKSKFSESAFISYVHHQNRTNHDDHLHCLFACFLSQLEPISVAKALEDPDWVAAMQEEMQQFYNQQVWKLVPLPDGKIAIGTKWILKNKRDARGIVVRNKARLVAQCHRQEEGIDYDEVYMDDIIFGSTNKAWCDEFEVLMKGEFEMSAMDNYVKDMLKKFDMESVRTATTPYEVPKHKSKDELDDAVYVHLFRSMIGSLMYLKASRPDIMFALKAYNDSDYAGSHGDRKSTTGGCQFLGRMLISWQCKKQTVVATSSTKSKYVAAASCCGQVLWIQNQMLDYGFNFMNTKIFIDNQSTICIVKNLVFHQQTKNIEIRYHFIRDANEKNLIQSTLGCSILRSPILLVVSVFLLVVLVHADGSYWWLYSSCWSLLVHAVGLVPSGSGTNSAGSYSFILLDWFLLVVLNWDGPHMPLLAPMLVAPAGGDGADAVAAGAAAGAAAAHDVLPPSPPPTVPPTHSSSSTPGPSTAAQATPMREPTPSPVREPTPFREPIPDSPIPPSPHPYPRSEGVGPTTSTRPPSPTRQTSFHKDISEGGGDFVSLPKFNEAPQTPAAIATGGAEDSAALTALSLKLDRCIHRVTSLENELGVTKKVLSGAVLKLVTRVKRLEGLLQQRKRRLVLFDSEGEEATLKEQDIDLDALHKLASTSLGGDSTVEASYTIYKASQDAHASLGAGHDIAEVPDVTTMPFRRTSPKRRCPRKPFTSSTSNHFPETISLVEDTLLAGEGIPTATLIFPAGSTPIPAGSSMDPAGLSDQHRRELDAAQLIYTEADCVPAGLSVAAAVSVPAASSIAADILHLAKKRVTPIVDIADAALIKFDSASDSDDDPLSYAPYADWEMVPSPLGSIHAYYDMKGHTKHFTSLCELLHMVHVLEMVDGWVIHMFVDVSYPLSAATLQRMLKHGLEVPKLLVGRYLTMAEQLVSFIKAALLTAQSTA
nr:putative ribonuclease H-like domain-containing protein [Tanacetum cinerariifolium]